MLNLKHPVAGEPVEWLGDAHPLLDRLGSPAGAASTGSVSPPRTDFCDAVSLQHFLTDYRDRILSPLELPAIQVAHAHASRGELRELLAHEARLAGEPLLQEFAEASRRAGRAQLSRLQPLRDQRLVRRYHTAVAKGEAHGWHTVVYGLVLAVYSVPLRQGLVAYAEQTLAGFTRAAARSLSLPEVDTTVLLTELIATIPATVQSVLTAAPAG